jgi:Na+-driven multidrug efflux pump
MIAGVAISGKIEGIVSMPVVTIGEALAVFTAQNLGAGRRERVGEGLKSAVKVCSVLAIALTVVVVFYGRYLISLFLDAYDPLIIEKGYRYMMSIMIMIFFMIPFRCLIGVFTGMMNMTVVLISFGLNIVGRVTSAYILYPFAKEFAVYIANPFSVLVGSLTVFYFYMRMAKGYHRIIRENVIV